MLLPLTLVAVVYWKWVGRPAEIGVATARMVLQLVAVGYFLLYLFESESPWVGLGVLVFMVGVSSWIAMRSTQRRTWQAYRRVMFSIGLAGGLNLALVVFFVMRLDPWYQLRAMIPIAGMVFSTAMNVVSLCAERYENDMERSGDHELSRKEAFRASSDSAGEHISCGGSGRLARYDDRTNSGWGFPFGGGALPDHGHVHDHGNRGTGGGGLFVAGAAGRQALEPRMTRMDADGRG